jgi:hypothetical protein
MEAETFENDAIEVITVVDTATCGLTYGYFCAAFHVPDKVEGRPLGLTMYPACQVTGMWGIACYR